MRKRDPYETLGIERDATHEQAKKRYRILALLYHPDRNPGDKAAEARFKEVQDAWSQLEHVLPRSGAPLEIPEGASEEEIEEAYVEWLLDPRNSQPTPDNHPAEAAQEEQEDEANVWSTVAVETAAGAVVRQPRAPVDWRKQTIRRYRHSFGLERISPEEAAQLLDSHPNAFAALKIVQQHWPELCLYDAILWRAEPARASHQNPTATALVIVGAAAVDQPGCKAALRDPLASVEMAQENLDLIGPRVRFGGALIAAEKLALDVYFLEENIRVLAETLRCRGGGQRPR